MKYLDERKIWGRKISSPGLLAVEQSWPCHWALRDYSIIYKEEDMYVRCLMNTNVLFKCNLFTYVAEACSISWTSEHTGEFRSSLPFLFASLASFPYQQASQKDLGSRCRIALGNVFRVTDHLEPWKENQDRQAPCSLVRLSVLPSHKDIRKRYL